MCVDAACTDPSQRNETTSNSTNQRGTTQKQRRKSKKKKEKAHTAESEAGKLIEPVARAEADKKGGGRSEDERDIPLK